MLRHKGTSIVSEIKDFFTSSEKAINTIFQILSSLTLSEKRLGIESKSNNEVTNISKLFLLLLFPFFEVKDAWHYQGSSLYQVYSYGKDIFYRFMNNSIVDWRRISYKLNMQLIGKTSWRTADDNERPSCLIIDDTDLPKTGRKIELIGKIFSHVTHTSFLGFKGLFMGYHDGKSFFAMDFSLHGERGKNKKKPYGMSPKELKKRFSKHRNKQTPSYGRNQEYFTTKIQSMIEMIRTAIKNGLRFDYVLVDSWFTCFELVKFIKTRRIKTNLVGMAKMGKTRYLLNGKNLTSKEIIDRQRKAKKVKRSKQLSCYYSEVIVSFNAVEVKLFFSKVSKKGKWTLLLTTDLELEFEQAYRIYSTRWQIEVFFKEAKQYLGLGKNQAQDFDIQIAATTLTVIQYNILSVAKRFTDYESVGELFRSTKAETIQLTVAERIWKMIVELLTRLSELFEVETELLMEKLISENERFTKLVNFNTLLQAG